MIWSDKTWSRGCDRIRLSISMEFSTIRFSSLYSKVNHVLNASAQVRAASRRGRDDVLVEAENEYSSFGGSSNIKSSKALAGGAASPPQSPFSRRLLKSSESKFISSTPKPRDTSLIDTNESEHLDATASFRMFNSESILTERLPVPVLDEPVDRLDDMITDASLTRIRRALNLMYQGYDEKLINELDPPAELMLQSTIASGSLYGLPEGSLTESFGGYSLNSAGEIIRHSNMVNKRRAQDYLTLAQLKLGIVPLQLIKKHAYVDSSVVDLSHYHIGDTHGK